MIILIDLKGCTTVLGFLDKVVKALKVMSFDGANLEVLGKTISSLEKHGFFSPLRLELLNSKQYQEKCPTGWNIFIKSLKKAKEEYAKRDMEFEYSFTD